MSDFIKILMDNGVSVGLAAFLLWFVLKPLIASHIKNIERQTEFFNQLIENLREERELCKEEFSRLHDKIEIQGKIMSDIQKSISGDK